MTQGVLETSTQAKVLDDGRGGFVPDTEVMSERGAIEVTELTPGDRVYALDPLTKLVKLKPVTEIHSSRYHGTVTDISARRIDFRLAPGQPFLYETRSKAPPRFRPAERLSEHEEYILINDWEMVEREAPETIDVTEFLDEFEACVSYDCHGHTFRAALPEGCEPIGRNQYVGYQFDGSTFKQYQSRLEELGTAVWIRDGTSHWRMPYRFQLEDFIQLIGWYVTEGSVTWKQNRDTAEIQIAQKKDEHRETIGDLLDRMGLEHHRQEKSFRFGSKLFGRLLEKLAGTYCDQKRLPDFVWSLPSEHQQLLLQTMLDGDGHEWQTYFTTSKQLARDACRLCTELGIKPRYAWRENESRRDICEVYIGRTNDQVTYSNQVSESLSSGPMFRVTIRDYPAILAGRNGRFQWIGANAVS